MKIKTQKTILTFTLSIFLFASFAIPRQTQARNLFRQFFHDIRRATHFIVSSPEKSTRWMGPVLGPIAADILTSNISSSRRFGQLFNRVRRTNKILSDVKEQNDALRDVRNLYREQAGDLRKQIDKIIEIRENFSQQMIDDPNYTFQDYKNDFISIDKMISSYQEAANRFDNTANNMGVKDVIKMVGQSALETVLGEAKNAVIFEAQSEIEKFLNPNVVKTFIRGDEGAMSILDLLIQGDLDKYLSGGNYDGIDIDALKDRIRDRIKEVIKENKDDLKNNWREKIQEIIDQARQDLEKEKEGLPDVKTLNNVDEVKNEIKKIEYDPSELAENAGMIPVDENGCRPGYVWKRMSGVGCVQENCIEVGGHYSYVQACICSFVEPKPGDKTKSCTRPSNYSACSGCVYSCILPEEECAY